MMLSDMARTSSAVVDDLVRDFLERECVGVLATTVEGRVRQSVVYYVLDGDRLLVSTVADRGKARDVERTGRASMCVLGHARPFPSVTIEGAARIVRENVSEPTARIASVIRGEPADPVAEDVLANVGRVILEIDIDRVYGASYLAES